MRVRAFVIFASMLSAACAAPAAVMVAADPGAGAPIVRMSASPVRSDTAGVASAVGAFYLAAADESNDLPDYALLTINRWSAAPGFGESRSVALTGTGVDYTAVGSLAPERTAPRSMGPVLTIGALQPGNAGDVFAASAPSGMTEERLRVPVPLTTLRAFAAAPDAAVRSAGERYVLTADVRQALLSFVACVDRVRTTPDAKCE